jgi:hypothetical protein
VLSYQKITDRIRKNQKTQKTILVFSMSRKAFWCYQDKMIVCDVSYLKPHIVAKKLGITTSALRMRRFRGSEDIDYIVNGKGRVMYLADSLEKHLDTFSFPPNVGESNPVVTTSDAFGSFDDHELSSKNNTKTKGSHASRTKDHRYMHSIGKINQKRIDDKIKRIQIQKERQAKANSELKARMSNERKHGTPLDRRERNYVSWVNPNTLGNYWNSIEDYENSKKKKPFKGYY